MMMSVMMMVVIVPRCNEDRCWINDRSRLVNDGRGLINNWCGLVNDRLLHDDLANDRSGLRIHDGRLLDDNLPNDRCGLCVDWRSGIDMNHLTPCLQPRNRSSDHCQCCDCDEGSFHNLFVLLASTRSVLDYSGGTGNCRIADI